MKHFFLSFVLTSAFFLIVDFLWLSFSVKFFYKPQLGDLLNDKVVIWAAVLFYLIYILGLAIIILKPAIDQDSIMQAFLTGIVFGVVAYGTYNFTNMATVKNWSPYVVFVDLAWGGFLTGTSCALGIYLSKKILF